MRNSERTHELFSLLLNSNGYLTAKEIAQVLYVSEKTVYRLVDDINEDMATTLIKSQRGRGFKLNYQYYVQPKKYQKLEQSSAVNLSPVERRNRIMKRLLLISPQKVKESEVFNQFYISANVRHHDKQIIKKILSEYCINLIAKNSLICVKGPEENIRRVLKDLIDDQEIIDLKQLPKSTDFSQKYDVQFVVSEIDKISYLLQTTLPYPYNVNLFSHLYILISRLRKNGTNYQVANKAGLDQKVFNSNIYQISKQVVNDISNYLSIRVPNVEADYIFAYLSSSRFINKTVAITTSKQVVKITKDLIEEVSSHFHYDFSFIEDRLEKHIQPLINRLKNHISVNNNLLEQIKMEYQQLFNIIQTAAKKTFTKYQFEEIDENEIGYITLYFAQALEENSTRLKVVIMCATGIGTSELLKIKVKKAFPNIEVLGVTASNNSHYDYRNVDLLISTVRVSTKIAVPSVVVSALFTKKDQTIVQNKIDEIVRNKRFEN